MPTELELLQVGKLVVSSMSLAASSTIAIMIVKRYRQFNAISDSYHSSFTTYSSPYSRIIFALSIADSSQSIAILTGTFLSPQNTPGAIWAIGNTVSCNANGFALIMGGIPIPMYTFVLTLYALLRVKFRMCRESFSEKLEWKLHSFIFMWTFCFAIFAIFTKKVNPLENGYVCTLREYPLNCEKDPETYGECERGQNAVLYLTIFYYIPLLLCFIGMVICLSSLSWYVFITERMMQQQDGGFSARKFCGYVCCNKSHLHQRESSPNLYEFSLESLKQSSLYVLAFLATHILNVATVLMLVLGGTPPKWFLTPRLFLYPLGGVFNILVYSRPKVIVLQKRAPELSWRHALYHVIMAGGDVPDEIEMNSPSISAGESDENQRVLAAAAAAAPLPARQVMEENKKFVYSVPSDVNDPRFISVIGSSL